MSHLELGVALEVWPSLEPARPHNAVLNPVVEDSSESDEGLGIHSCALSNSKSHTLGGKNQGSGFELIPLHDGTFDMAFPGM